MDRLHLLQNKRTDLEELPIRVVLDTDTSNEIDDQFALAHLLLAPDRVKLEAIYAAPFHNARSSGPADGMRKSLAEARRVMDAANVGDIPTFEGAQEWLTVLGEPQESAAALDLITRSAAKPSPLHVVAIGAATNVAMALALDPTLIERVAVVWLGGNSSYWPDAHEFNLEQDVAAARVLLDCDVPVIRVPCLNVADHLITTKAEIDDYVRPSGPLGRLLADLYANYVEVTTGRSKVIWDLAATACVLDPSWVTATLVHSPVLTSELTWSHDARRHLVGEVTEVSRDQVFGDLFSRLARHATSGI